MWKQIFNGVMDRKKLEEFWGTWKQSLDVLKIFFIEIWMLKVILEKAQRREVDCRENIYDLREYIYHQEQTCARSVNVKGLSGEDSDKNEKHVIRNWMKDSPYKAI